MEAQKSLFHHAEITARRVFVTLIASLQSAVVTDSATFPRAMLAAKSHMKSMEHKAFQNVFAYQVRDKVVSMKSLNNHALIGPKTALPPEATIGLCDNDRCLTKRNIFIALFALTVFIHSTSEVGGMLIIMRCTHPKDKAMAMGIIQFSIGLLSNIPCPNIYARIIDATCIVWTKICGNNGHCSLYDSDSFRRYFFGMQYFLLAISVLTFNSCRRLMLHNAPGLRDGYSGLFQVTPHRYRS